MKIKHILFLQAVALMTLSCNNDLIPDDNSAIRATMSGYENADMTKVAFPDGLNNFQWSNGDCIGVCRSGASANGTAAFTLLKGGSNAGNFINDAFSLNPETEYTAFYPFKNGTTSTNFTVDVTGQVQDGNRNLAHIGKYNYMYSNFKTNSESGADFTFTNICSVIQIHFTASKEATYTSLTVNSDNVPFDTKANFSFASGTFVSTLSGGASNTITLSLGKGMHVYNGEPITLSMVAIPKDMGGSNLTFTINYSNGDKKEFTLAAFAMAGGKLYQYYENDAKGNPPYGSCPDGDHHHAIDLGLPSGTLWACCDLGADQPWEFGPSLAWGETSLVTKNTSNWLNYQFMKDDNEEDNEKGINKYQIPDNRYDMPWYRESDSTFIGDGRKQLLASDDAAAVNWGGAWRMPTREEAEELLNYTYRVETDNYNGTGQSGHIFYKKKDNGTYNLWDTHIFIPANDWTYYYGGTWHTIGTSFWTSNLVSTKEAYAPVIGGWRYSTSTCQRTDLKRIRPVRSAK